MRQQLVSSLDWLPTLANAAGLSTTGLVLDGQPLQAVIASSTDTVHEALCWTYGVLWAVREGRWKLMGSGVDDILLYDLELDPGERVNQLAEQQDLFRHLAGVRNRWAEALRHDPTVIRELGL